MKRILSLLTVFCLLCSFAACSQTESPSSSSQSEAPTVSSEPTQEPTDSSAMLDALRADYPVTDGSTSLIPLDAGVRAAILGISIDEATAQLTHTTTYDSFYNLLNGSVDLTYSVPISESQRQVANEQGVELEQVAVAREGFVFVVNAQNPVDSLTQEQLRGIYSGEITNWSEVGGNDEPIVAYQRNSDSGSQNYMISFMGDTPLTDAPTELRPTSMSGLMDVIAANDYATQSIGYSVYAYAADMYGNGSEIKFLAVDGVAPSKATMASGEYPLLSDNYAIFRADEPEDSNVRLLCAWMTSDAGQLAIAEAGYVTVRDIGYDYAEAEAGAAFTAEGTGLESWEAPTLVNGVVSTGRNTANSLPLTVTLPSEVNTVEVYDTTTSYTTGIQYTLDCLTNTALQTEINGWLAEAVNRADDHTEELRAYIDRLNDGYDYLMYSQRYDWENGISDFYPSAVVEVKAQNGYLWATVAQIYTLQAQDGYDRCYRVETATWDLLSGKRLEVSDLFKAGTDVGGVLNLFLQTATQQPIDSWGTYLEMKTDFTALPAEGWCMNPEALYFDNDNSFTAYGYRFDLSLEPGLLCAEAFRDMAGCFTDQVTVTTTFARSGYEPVHAYANDELFTVELLDETVGDGTIRAKINADFLSRLTDFTLENAAAYFTETFGAENPEPDAWGYGWYLTEYTGRFVAFKSDGYFAWYDESSEDGMTYSWPDSMRCWLYDLQTGERVEWSDLLVEDWQSLAKVEYEIDYETSEGSIEELALDALPPLTNFSMETQTHPDTPFCFDFWKWDAEQNADVTSIDLPLAAFR